MRMNLLPNYIPVSNSQIDIKNKNNILQEGYLYMKMRRNSVLYLDYWTFIIWTILHCGHHNYAFVRPTPVTISELHIFNCWKEEKKYIHQCFPLYLEQTNKCVYCCIIFRLQKSNSNNKPTKKTPTNSKTEQKPKTIT